MPAAIFTFKAQYILGLLGLNVFLEICSLTSMINHLLSSLNRIACSIGFLEIHSFVDNRNNSIFFW